MSWQYIVSGEVALKQAQKADPPIIPREGARKRELVASDQNDKPYVSIEYPGFSFQATS